MSSAPHDTKQEWQYCRHKRSVKRGRIPTIRTRTTIQTWRRQWWWHGRSLQDKTTNEAWHFSSHQHEHEELWLLLTLAVSCRVWELFATADDGSASKLSDILSQMMSTNRSNTAFTFTLSFADVSKNSKPTTVKYRNFNSTIFALSAALWQTNNTSNTHFQKLSKAELYRKQTNTEYLVNFHTLKY